VGLVPTRMIIDFVGCGFAIVICKANSERVRIQP